MSDPGLSYVSLEQGDLFPWVSQRSDTFSAFGVDRTAGPYLVLCFFGSANHPDAIAALDAVQRHRSVFDGLRARFFGVSVDPQDEVQNRVRDLGTGMHVLWDFDASVSLQCGALPKPSGQADAPAPYRQFWLIVDPTLHVLARFPFGPDPSRHDAVFAFLGSLPPPHRYAGFELPAPILVLPNVFDAQTCRHLVGLYDHHGGDESGIYLAGGGVLNHAFKRRKDFEIQDQDLIRRLQLQISRKVLPEIERLFFMKITRMERYIIGCYAAEDGGHFQPHRDNGPGLTAHRRYAVSINLTDDFDGGEVSFPEYSARGIKAPRGWCVVFPAAILHKVSKVTRGRRYAFLPFVYDEGGAKIRQAEIARYQRENPASTGQAAQA